MTCSYLSVCVCLKSCVDLDICPITDLKQTACKQLTLPRQSPWRKSQIWAQTIDVSLLK